MTTVLAEHFYICCFKCFKVKAALCAFLTAGHPTREGFPDLLGQVAGVADLVEIGVPFSDPMADGLTIQRASHDALRNGVTLRWILDALRGLPAPAAAPLVLMSYVNPLLAFGFNRLAHGAVEAGVAGVVVPDLPLEESAPLDEALRSRDLALVQLVTPATPQPRLRELCRASRGFVYAVTVTGTTGGSGGVPAALLDYLDRVRTVSTLPVLAGFGIRSRRQVEAIARHADGVVVGSALIEVLERGEDPARFLRGLCREAPGVEQRS